MFKLLTRKLNDIHAIQSKSPGINKRGFSMAENDELDPLNNPEGEIPIDEEAQAEQTKIDGIIENLLSSIDLPGDKEIDRSPAPGLAAEDESQDEGDVLGEGQWFAPGEEIDYSDRPDLKTDKRRRITVDDLDSLFNDYERTISGGKAGDEPIFGKEIEPEKRVEDHEELQAQKLETERLQGSGDTGSQIPTDEELVTGDLDLANEMESPMDSGDIESTSPDELAMETFDLGDDIDTEDPSDKTEIETQTLDEPLEEDDFSLDAFDIEKDIVTEEHKVESTEDRIDELKMESDESITDGAEDFSFGEIDFEDEALQAEESPDSNDVETLQETSTEDTIGDKMDQEALEDIDEKIHEEESYIPDLDFEDVASKEEVAPDDFDDLDQYIEERKSPSTLMEEPAEAIGSQMMDKSSLSETNEIVESEFDDLVPLDKDFEREEAGRSTLKELEGETASVSDEFYSIPDMESIEDELFEEPERDQEVITNAASVETKVAETFIEEPVKESYSIPKEEAFQEPDKQETDFDDFDLPEMETPSEIEKSEPSLQTTELEPSMSKTQEPLTDKAPSEELQFTDEEQEIILMNLKKLPEPLSTITTDTIVQEKLPINDINFLTQKLIHNPIPSDVKDFLEDRLGITIPLREAGRPRAVRREVKSAQLGPLSKLAIAAILIASFGLGLWFLALRPYFQKQENIEMAVAKIQGGAQSYSVKDIQNINLMDVINQAIQENDIKTLNRFAAEFIKKGDAQALDNAHILLLGNNKPPGAEEISSIESFNGTIKITDPSFKGAIGLDPSNKETLFLIVDMYSQKAIRASRVNPENVNNYCSLAKNLLEEKDQDQDDIEILNRLAQVHILWGNLIGKENKPTEINNYDRAKKLYESILDKEPKNASGLYGLLEIYLVQLKSLPPNPSTKSEKDKIKNYKANIHRVYNNIEHAKLSDENINKKVLSEYAYYLYKQIDKKLNNTQAFRTEQKVMKILSRVIESKGPIYPKAYLYQGLIYQDRNPKRSVGRYIRGLFSYYALKYGEEKLNERMNEGDTTDMRVEKRTELVKYLRDKVIEPDTNIENNQLQSRFFNNIGENYLVLSKDFREKQDKEREKKENLVKSAVENFYWATKKDPLNFKPWKNRGDLSYSMNVDRKDKSSAKFIYAKLNYLLAVLLLVKEKSMGKVDLFRSLDNINIRDFLVKLLGDGQKQSSVNLQDFYKVINIKTLQDHFNMTNTPNKINKTLVTAQSHDQVDPQLFYKIGYIFYYEKKYRLASEFWGAIHASYNDTKWKYNPILNYSLANSYLKNRRNTDAIRYYEKIIEFYEDTVYLYKRNLDPNNPDQNKVFKRLAYAHNNLGVAYHLKGQKDLARYHYYKGSEYASMINLKGRYAKLKLNILRLNRNINLVNYKNIHLISGRKPYQYQPRPKDPKVKGHLFRILYPAEEMMIDDLDKFLKD